MTRQPAERLTREHRLRSSREFNAVKSSGMRFRGKFCLLLVLARPGELTRFGFITSRRSLGCAVRRNRGRRRLREIVRRRFPRMPQQGYWIVVIAYRAVLDAGHQELASEVEQLLAQAGALSPIESPEH